MVTCCAFATVTPSAVAATTKPISTPARRTGPKPMHVTGCSGEHANPVDRFDTPSVVDSSQVGRNLAVAGCATAFPTARRTSVTGSAVTAAAVVTPVGVADSQGQCENGQDAQLTEDEDCHCGNFLRERVSDPSVGRSSRARDFVRRQGFQEKTIRSCTRLPK